MKPIADSVDQVRERIQPRPAPRYIVTPSSEAEELGRIEAAIRRLAAECDEKGRCGACHGTRFLRADVPLEHKLFGKYRCCVCNPQYEQFRGAWF